MSTITVIKFDKKYLEKQNYIYIGRQNKYYGLQASPLANPYFLNKNKNNRDEVINCYKKWLWINMKKGMAGEDNIVWNELHRLANIVEDNDIYLMCWCAPKPCHGDIIKKAIEWLFSALS